MNPQRKAKKHLSVDRSVDRSTDACQRSTDPVDRRMSTVDRPDQPDPTESSMLSVGQPGGRPLYAMVDRAFDQANLVHVVHTGRPGGRRAFYIGRPCGRPGAFLAWFNALVLLLWFPISVLATSISSLPTIRLCMCLVFVSLIACCEIAEFIFV